MPTIWEIDGDQLLLHKRDEKSDVQAFTMKKISDGKWELINDDVTFHLIRKEK